MIVALIGPTGAGKGTQADRIAAEQGFVHVSVGNLLRDHLERGTSLGGRVRSAVEAGDLVPEDVVDTMVRDRLATTRPEDDIFLDGYPRTEDQAVALDETLAGIGRDLAAAIYLDVRDEKVVTERIPGRLTCRGCQRPYHERFNPPSKPAVCDRCGGPLYRRPDDTSERSGYRLRDFHRQADPILARYQAAGRLIILDANEAIEPVHHSLGRILDALRRHNPPLASEAETERIRDLHARPRTIPEGDVCDLTLDLVLIGAPGSGKGTQAERLSGTFGIPHVATGDLFREHLRNETELGKLARSYIERGDLVPDDVTQGMVRDRLRAEDTNEGFVLDGFPRTLPQAEALTDMLTTLSRRLSAVLYIRVSDEEIVRRLSGRRVCPSCQTTFHETFQPPRVDGKCDRCGGKLEQRDDDRPETVRERLRTYRRKTAPLVDHYERQGLLVEIAGEGEVEEIGRRAIDAVERFKWW